MSASYKIIVTNVQRVEEHNLRAAKVPRSSCTHRRHTPNLPGEYCNRKSGTRLRPFVLKLGAAGSAESHGGRPKGRPVSPEVRSARDNNRLSTRTSAGAHSERPARRTEKPVLHFGSTSGTRITCSLTGACAAPHQSIPVTQCNMTAAIEIEPRFGKHTFTEPGHYPPGLRRFLRPALPKGSM